MEQLAEIYQFYDDWGIVRAFATLGGFLVFWLSRIDKVRREAKANKSEFYFMGFIYDEFIAFLISGILTLIGCPALHQLQELNAFIYLIIGWSGGSMFKYAYEKFMANLDSIPILKSLGKK